jgi:HlyD family secretion protein
MSAMPPGDEGPAEVVGASPLPLQVVRREAGRGAVGGGALRVLRRVGGRVVPAALLVVIGGVIGLHFRPLPLRKVMCLLGIAEAASGAGGEREARAAGAVAGEGRRVVVGLGRLLPESGVITVAAPFGAGDARVASLKVQEGERVEAGAVLAVLDSERPLLAAVGAARAVIAAREATRGQVGVAVVASRGEIKAQIARAEVSWQSAGRDLDRAEALHREGAMADQPYEQQRAARDEAAREVERLRATLSRYGSGQVQAQTDVVVAGRNIEVARMDLERALADLDRAYVRAPLAGTVLTIHAQPGERPGNVGVLTLGNLDRMKVEVDVYQTQIGGIEAGDGVEFVAAALPGKLRGRVTRVGLEVGRQQSMDPSPAANTDARVVKVTVALDAGSTALARRFTNLQVTSRIFPGSRP